jgi:hypothetical protein
VKEKRGLLKITKVPEGGLPDKSIGTGFSSPITAKKRGKKIG